MREAKAWVRESARSRKEKRRPENKLWEVIYEDPTADPPYKQRTKGGFKGSKKAAQEWAANHRDVTKHGKYVDPTKGTATFSQVAAEWFSVKPFKRINTKESDRAIIEGKNHLTRTFNDVPVADITYGAVLGFIKETSQVRAPQTVLHQFYVLRNVLDYATKHRMLAANPARMIDVKRDLPKPKKMKEHEEKRHPLTIGETERIIAAMPQPYDVFTRLVAFTGMRPEEAVALTLEDLDLDEGTVTVRSVLVGRSGPIIREHFTKSDAGKRTIDLDTATLDVLVDYISRHRRRAAKWFAEHPDARHFGAAEGEALPLFVGLRNGGDTSAPALDRLDYSKPMRYSVFYRRHWHRARKAAGVPTSLRMYDLRHAEVSRFVARMGKADEFALKEIQERYGHESAVMTLDRYGHSRKVDRAARRRELDAAYAEERAREAGADNVSPIASRRRAN